MINKDGFPLTGSFHGLHTLRGDPIMNRDEIPLTGSFHGLHILPWRFNYEERLEPINRFLQWVTDIAVEEVQL